MDYKEGKIVLVQAIVGAPLAAAFIEELTTRLFQVIAGRLLHFRSIR